MNVKIVSTATVFIILVLLTTSGCVRTFIKKPFFISDSFKPRNEQLITVLPSIKLGYADGIDIEFDVEGRVKGEIINRGYTFLDKTKIKLPNSVTAEMLSNLDFKWLNQLDIEENSWVLIIVVETLKRQQHGIGLRADSILSGYLVDPSTDTIIWEGAGFGSNTGGVLLAALVDDIALHYAESDLMRSLPINKAAKNKPDVSTNTMGQYYNFAAINGYCPNGECDKNDSKAHICIINDKSNSFLNDDDEDDEYGDTDRERIANTYPLYDARKKVADIAIGGYVCWTKTPGKTILHLDMHRPAYFRAEAGKHYNLNSKFANTNTWVFNEIPESKIQSFLTTYKGTNLE